MGKKKQVYECYIYLDHRYPSTYPGEYRCGDIDLKCRPFYVGQGKKGRRFEHLKSSCLKKDTNTFKTRTIVKIEKETGRYPDSIVLQYCNTRQEVLDLEIFSIWAIGRKNRRLGPLTNLTDGGDGNYNIIHSKSAIDKLAELSSKEYIISNIETGENFIIKNLKKYCKDNGLRYARMRSLSRGSTQKPEKGIFKCEHRYNKVENKYCSKCGEPITISSKKNLCNVCAKLKNIYKIITPDNHIYQINNLYKYCNEHLLDSTSMWKVANQKLLSYKGYKCHKITETV